ncbi:Monocarboxylate transporter 2 [Holothuria leucospilota]|uniref:Monocarboxylate transporter 2 n=1 Tax=Holothuria leucospilota TaxID=206669 RepID=A0A9Q1C1K1_HOLLE|nr:Monocarboxylate transporter 2 [Holothuria leucospilota]
MTAPVAKLLLKVFTYRQLAVGGGFLAGFGYVYCGIGFALSALPGYIILEDHFQDQFPKALSASSLFNFIGIAVLPPLLQYLKTLFGSREAFILFGAVTWHMIPAGFGLRDAVPRGGCIDRPSVSKRHAKTKRDLKFVNKYLSFCSCLFYHKNYAILVVTEFLSSLIYISWALFLVSLGTSAGLREESAVILSTAAGVGSFLGTALAIGLFHFQKMNAYTSCAVPLLVNGIGLVGLTFARDFNSLLSLTLLTGFCLGVNISGMIGIIPSLVCRYHFQQAVVINYFIDGIAYQFGGLISGAIRDLYGSTLYVYGFAALLSFVALPWILIWACNKDPNRECEPDLS